MKITMVERIMPDGSRCPKCRNVMALLEERGLRDRIDAVVAASPRKPGGQGMRLFKKHKMKRAPFFVVEEEDDSVTVYDSVLRLIRDLFPESGEAEENQS